MTFKNYFKNFYTQEILKCFVKLINRMIYTVNEIEFTKDTLSVSNVLKELIDLDPDTQDLTFPEIKNEILLKVKSFLEHYIKQEMNYIHRPVDPENFEISVPQKFYSEFVNLPEKEIIEILNAAERLEIIPLRDLCCAKIAFNIRNATKEELCERFFSGMEKQEKQKLQELGNLTQEEVIYKHYNVTDKLSDEEKEILENNDTWQEPIY